jgi:hypothetical protein
VQETEKTRQKRARLSADSNSHVVVRLHDRSKSGTKMTDSVVKRVGKDHNVRGRLRSVMELVSGETFFCGTLCVTQTIINNYRLLSKLGSGSFGTVHLCEDVHSGARFAIKAVDKAKLRRRRLGQSDDQLRQEVTRMKRPLL